MTLKQTEMQQQSLTVIAISVDEILRVFVDFQQHLYVA